MRSRDQARPINVRVEAPCRLDLGHHDVSETRPWASLARADQFLNVVVINRNLDDDRLRRGAYLNNDAPSGVERWRIEKEKFINAKMRAQIQPLHPLLVGAEGGDEKSVGILILRNKFLRRAFIIDAISGANPAVAVDAIGEIQRRRSHLVDERSEKDNRSLPTNSLHGRKGAISVFLNVFDRYIDVVGGFIFLVRDLPGCPGRPRLFPPLRFCLLPLAFLQRGARFFLLAFCLLPLTLFLLLLCLETTLRHASDRGWRLRVPIRRPATLILELLTI